VEGEVVCPARTRLGVPRLPPASNVVHVLNPSGLLMQVNEDAELRPTKITAPKQASSKKSKFLDNDLSGWRVIHCEFSGLESSTFCGPHILTLSLTEGPTIS